VWPSAAGEWNWPQLTPASLVQCMREASVLLQAVLQGSMRQHLQELDERLAHLGLEQEEVAGDGNCFFHALVLQLQVLSLRLSLLGFTSTKVQTLTPEELKRANVPLHLEQTEEREPRKEESEAEEAEASNASSNAGKPPSDDVPEESQGEEGQGEEGQGEEEESSGGGGVAEEDVARQRVVDYMEEHAELLEPYLSAADLEGNTRMSMSVSRLAAAAEEEDPPASHAGVLRGVAVASGLIH